MENKDRIETTVEALLNKAGAEHLYSNLTIKYNMRGKSAGQFQYKNNSYILRFNMGILETNGWEKYENTVTHEVAHLINYYRNGSYKNGKRVFPHGREFKNIMGELGAVANTTHDYALPESVKKSNTFTYECNCQEHELGKIRHERMQKGVYKGKKYSLSCKKCGQKLRLKR